MTGIPLEGCVGTAIDGSVSAEPPKIPRSTWTMRCSAAPSERATCAAALSGIPVTYVPARNTVLLSLALAYAEVSESDAIFTGANAVDYSGYPDCRPEYLSAFEKMANLATRRAVEGKPLEVMAPIVDMTKAQIVRRGHDLGVDFSHTVSCYNADAAGRACARCDSCRFRREGFEKAGISDPTRYQHGAL